MIKKILKRWKEIVLIVLFLTTYNELYMPFQRSTKTDEEILNPVVKTVESELRQRGLKFTNADVKMVEELSLKGSVGTTSGFKWLQLVIRFNREYFKKASPEEQEALVLHEYGHYLGIDHKDVYMYRAVWRIQCPESVMHPSDDMVGCFDSLRNYYYNELVQAVLTHRAD